MTEEEIIELARLGDEIRKRPEKIKITQTHKIKSGNILHGKLEDIIAMLQDWKNEGGWEGIQVYWLDNGRPRYELYKVRLETDEEFEIRMKKLGNL